MSKPTPFMEFLDGEQGKWEQERKKEAQEKGFKFQRGDKYFAAYLGVPPTTYSELKSGSREATPLQLKRIGRKLPGVWKIVGRSQADNDKLADPRLRRIAQIYNELQPRDQEKLIEAAEGLIGDDKDDGQGSTDLRQINLGLT